MRKYALVILDNKDQPIDRFNLDIVTNPKGNGFELDMSVISSDLEDIITKVVQKKNKITFVVQQIFDSYTKANALANWIQKYSKTEYQMCLEYNDGDIVRYCEGKVTRLEKNEKTYPNVLQQTLEFTQTTPYFIKQENTITIQKSSIGKSYPFKYPYSYGSSAVINNDINNPYILDVPLIIIIDGIMSGVRVDLLGEDGEQYNTVEMIDENGIPLILEKGEQLIINSAQRKIIKVNASGTEEDYSHRISPRYDSFLRATAGRSKINVNLDSMGEGFKLTGSWRQYSL